MLNLFKKISVIASSFFEWINRNALITALIIFSIHLLIKSVDLGVSGFWYDEAYSVYHSQKAVNEIMDNAKVDHNPPFYNLILKVWMMCFGMTEAAVRWLSVIFSALAGVALFFICRRHFNIQTAFFASVLYLASNVHVYYSHEARSYTLTLLLSILSVHFCLEIIKRPAKSKLFTLGIINAAILYTHFLTGFLFIAEFLIILVLINRSRKGFIYYLLSQVLTIILFAPWIPAVINMVNQTNKSFWLGHPTWQDLSNVFFEFAMGKDLLVFYGFLIVFVLAIILYFRKNELENTHWKNIIILVIWGFLPIFIDYFVSSITPVFLLRYVLYASLGLMVLVAYIISLSPGGPLPKLVLIISLALILFSRIDYSPAKNQDLKAAMPLIKNEKDSNTLVVLSPADMFFFFSYYYNKSYFRDYYNTNIKLLKDNVIMTKDSTGLSGFDFSVYSKIILVQSFKGYSDPQGTLPAFFKNKFDLRSNTDDFSGITVAVYNNQNFDPAKQRLKAKKQKLEFGDAALSPDTPEGTNGWTNLGSLTDEKAAEGKYSSKISKESPFSLTLTRNIETYKLDHTSTFKLSCQVYPESSGDIVDLAISFHNKAQEQISWNSRSSKSFPVKTKNWNKIEFTCPYPVNTDSIVFVKAFFWYTAGNGPVYVDEIKLEIEE